LHLETAKDIATKGEKLRPEHSSTIVQNFTPIGATVAEISVPDKRTLALRLLDNNRIVLKSFVRCIHHGFSDYYIIGKTKHPEIKQACAWILVAPKFANRASKLLPCSPSLSVD